MITNPIDFICNDLLNEANLSKDRIAMRSLGPPTKSCPYIVMINGPDSATLQTVISGRDPELRKPLEVFIIMFGDTKNSITSVSFLTDVTHGLEKRQSIKHLISKHKLVELRPIVDALLNKHFSDWTKPASVNDLSSKFVFDFFGKIIGFDNVPFEAVSMYEEVENRVIYDAPPWFGWLPLTLSQWRYRNTAKTYQREFIPKLFKNNTESILRGENYTYTIMKEMAEKIGGLPSDYINDPSVMTSPSLFLATGNLVSLISFSFFILFDKSNSSIKERLFSELQSAKNFDEIKRLPYTDKVYKELLRYISPANLISRYTSKNLVFGDKTINKGSYMMVSLKSILHDEKQWDNPERFNPDRVIPKHLIYPFIPFSTGERMCPGVQVTEMVFKQFLYFLKDYNFISNDNPSIPIRDPVIRLDKKYTGYLVSL